MMRAVFFCIALLVTSSVFSTATAQTKELRQMNVCVIRNDTLMNVPVEYEAGTGNRTVVVNGARIPFAEAFPTDGRYAAVKTWYINNESIILNNRKYDKYGLPRILSTMDV